MANAFVTVLDKIGEGIKWAFTNKTATTIETDGIDIAEIAFPAVAPLLNGVAKSIAVAQGLAATVPAGLSTAQMIALVASDAEAAFTEYENTTGTKIETAQQSSIITALINLLSSIPGAASTTVATATAQPSVAAVTATSVTQAAPAVAVAASASAGTLL